MNKLPSWNYFKRNCIQIPELGMSLDISRMNAPEKLSESLLEKFKIALEKMEDLEKGIIANPDENQMVGHYWLRNSLRLG